uniref:Calcium-dependent protein kinase 3-like n=1 Tax=Dermatophagoides pteronyssinus TaxID=6956 RepID=A0A6P6YBY0_DERPT
NVCRANLPESNKFYIRSFVACKCILKTIFKPGNIEKFRLEIELMRRCDHANIAKIYEFYEDEKYLYLLEEACYGGELFDYITSPNYTGDIDKKENPKKAAQHLEVISRILMKQLLNSVSYLHLRGIVHRDIKPENIILKYKNDISNVKLVDFGLSSKLTDEKLKETVGTPYYIAPEVLDKSYDYRCDIWSLGVLLYILISGSPPFYGNTDSEIIEAVRNKKYSFSSSFWKYVSNECKDLISKMLVYPPADRYTASQCIQHPVR